MKTLRWENHNGKWWVVTECDCGKVSKNKKSDLVKQIDNPNYACRSCTMVRRAAENADNPTWIANWQKGLAKANEANANKPKISKEDKHIRQILSMAKQRCTNPNCTSYDDYGGRGIEFRFADIETAHKWVVDNIGYPPSSTHSLDRIDNNRHYEAGNLRWATRQEQANNKRAYKRGVVGSRIAEIQKHRPDLTYESIRYAIKQGYSNDQIINKPRNRHFSSSL